MMNCLHCESASIIKAGFQSGKQRYKCNGMGPSVCKRSHRGVASEIKEQALAMYLQGLGFRAIGRLRGLSNVAVLKWVRKAG